MQHLAREKRAAASRAREASSEQRAVRFAKGWSRHLRQTPPSVYTLGWKSGLPSINENLTVGGF